MASSNGGGVNIRPEDVGIVGWDDDEAMATWFGPYDNGGDSVRRQRQAFWSSFVEKVATFYGIDSVCFDDVELWSKRMGIVPQSLKDAFVRMQPDVLIDMASIKQRFKPRTSWVANVTSSIAGFWNMGFFGTPVESFDRTQKLFVRSVVSVKLRPLIDLLRDMSGEPFPDCIIAVNDPLIETALRNFSIPASTVYLLLQYLETDRVQLLTHPSDGTVVGLRWLSGNREPGRDITDLDRTIAVLKHTSNLFRLKLNKCIAEAESHRASALGAMKSSSDRARVSSKQKAKLFLRKKDMAQKQADKLERFLMNLEEILASFQGSIDATEILLAYKHAHLALKNVTTRLSDTSPGSVTDLLADIQVAVDEQSALQDEISAASNVQLSQEDEQVLEREYDQLLSEDLGRVSKVARVGQTDSSLHADEDSLLTELESLSLTPRPATATRFPPNGALQKA